ncbi:MAG: FGGY family carbohydrate kinase [Acidimicrobiales bacterium]
MSILVVDVGTSGVRAAIVTPDGEVTGVQHRDVLPSTPMQGFVEFDAGVMAEAVLGTCRAALAGSGPVDAVGIANQRASTIVWDRATLVPVASGIGWQDLRTVGMCLALRQEGIRVAPNKSATKLVAILDMVDPDRRRDLCFGTVDSWVASVLSGGALHVTDHTNAGLTDLVTDDGSAWDAARCDVLNIPLSVLPEIHASCGVIGEASALAGAPPIAGIAGDQQASLVGQGCLWPGTAKATFGTGGMLDCAVGPEQPAFAERGGAGTFPMIAWSTEAQVTWGIEAVMLSAGSCVEWLRDDLGLVTTAAETDEIAGSVRDAGGVYFVPALLGLGTPVWDFGARGTLLGITRGTTRAEVVRAVLEGVAHRGADLLEAVVADSGIEVPTLKVDGGMSANGTFLQALADATGRPIEVAAVTEATTLGAAYLAGTAVGTWSSLEATASLRHPRAVIEPARRADRERWLEARSRSERTVPELSSISF